MYNITESIKSGDYNRIVFTPLLIASMAANLFILFKITKKHWNNFLPLHLHQINFFFNFFIITSGGLVTAWSVREDTPFSVFILFFMFFVQINFIAAILLLQIDRLLAIASPYFHKSDITTSLSCKVILASMIFTFLVAISATMLDPGLVLHQSCYRCIFVCPSSVFLHSLPSLVSFLLTLVVSILATVKVHEQIKVEPVIMLNTVSSQLQETQERKNAPSKNLTSEGSLDEETLNGILDDVGPLQQCSSSLRNERKLKSRNSKKNIHREAVRSNETEIQSTNDQVSTDASSQDIKEYEEETMSESEEDQEEKISAKKFMEEFSSKNKELVHIDRKKTETNISRNIMKDDQRKMLRSTLKMNLVTIALLLFILPRHCLAIHYYQCYVTQGNCTNYLLLFNKAAFLQLCVTFTLPLIVSRLVDQIS